MVINNPKNTAEVNKHLDTNIFIYGGERGYLIR
jgi:hypothetical protein